MPTVHGLSTGGERMPTIDPQKRISDLDHKAFDAAGFLELLGEVMFEHDTHTGVVSVRIHVRDGVPWAVSVQFDNAAKKTA